MTSKKTNQNKDMEPLNHENTFENTIFMNFNGLNISIELMEKQSFKNMEAIPIKTDYFSKKDFITIKKGYDMGLVEIKELEDSTVNTVMCKNDAVVPLLLIEGDEIIGAKQNRIINDSMLIPANTRMNISVSCTEHGRWRYKNDKKFRPSEYSLNQDTKSRRRRGVRDNLFCQSIVWDSVSDLERKNNFKSDTSALYENYANSKDSQDDYLKHFDIKNGQNGVILFVDGQFKGIELFYNHNIYKEYHEKTFRSYIIDSLYNNDFEKTEESKMIMEINNIFDNISSSDFEKYNTVGIGENIKFNNLLGSGSGLLFEDELIHMSYSYNFDDNDEFRYAEDVNLSGLIVPEHEDPWRDY